MFVLSWQMTLAALLLVPFFILHPGRYWGRKPQTIARASANLNAAMNSLRIERFNVAGAHIAKLFGRPQNDRKEFGVKASRVSEIAVKRTIYGRLFFTSLTLTTILATSVAYGWGGVLAVHHKLDVGAAVAFVSYMDHLYSTLTGLSNIPVTLTAALVSFERAFEVLDLPPMIRDGSDAIAVPGGPARVAFHHVSFRYPAPSEVPVVSLESIAAAENNPQQTILSDITFIVAPGQLVAIVGPSGAGKTT